MELWIRTQDRECLTKVNHLYINEKGNNIYEISQEDDIPLGKYISKERALEVLDEIQKKITPVTIIRQTHPTKYIDDKKTISDTVLYIQEDVDVKKVGMIIYEMPKE